MSKRTEEQKERWDGPRQKPPLPSGEKKRKLRGALFHGNDPALAKRAEEELYSFEH